MIKKTYCIISSWEKTYGGNDGDGGIHVYEMAPDGALTQTDWVNPELAIGYVAISPDGKYVYGINETKFFSNTDSFGGSVLAYELDAETGRLKFLNTVPTCGVFPCFLTIANDGSHLIATNYGSLDTTVHTVRKEDGTWSVVKAYDEGSVVLIPINADGTVAPVSSLTVHTKTSIDTKRQVSVHPHSVNVDPKDEFAFVCDRGGDLIYTYRLDKSAHKLIPCCEFHTKAGTGPRHLAFHPTKDLFYVVSELTPNIAAYSFNRATGEITEINMISCEHPNYHVKDASFGAGTHPADVHVHPNGKFVYASLRGMNAIGIYNIDAETGAVSFNNTLSSQGTTPRTFNFDPSGKYIMVTNQDTNTAYTFNLNDDSTITPTGHITYVDQPVCVKFTEV